MTMKSSSFCKVFNWLKVSQDEVRNFVSTKTPIDKETNQVSDRIIASLLTSNIIVPTKAGTVLQQLILRCQEHALGAFNC